MRKRTYFLDHPRDGWPDLAWLKPNFLTTEGRKEAFGEQESWGLGIDGLDGTQDLLPRTGRIDLDLHIQGDPHYGILLCWSVRGGGRSERKYSLGHVLRMNRWLRSGQGDRRPVGLFIPFEAAWLATQEFILREGTLPRCVAWIDERSLPADAFVDPDDRWR